MRHVPEIKLIRTDTTLDLSQKAEKVWLESVALPLIKVVLCYFFQWVLKTSEKVKQRVPGSTPTGGRKNKNINFFVFFIFRKRSVCQHTRSTWRYCNTRATLGQGGTQAYQDRGRGLNKSLKLMWRHAPRTRD